MRYVVALVLVLCFTLAAYAALTDPVKLIFAAQEVGTGAYSVSSAIQVTMLKGLPQARPSTSPLTPPAVSVLPYPFSVNVQA